MKKTWTLCEKIMNVYKGECALYHHQSGKHTVACTKKWRDYPLRLFVQTENALPQMILCKLARYADNQFHMQ